jgi:UDP-N-acetylmuramoyl-L-alanyl-D-glutamate--2,6-diaminopimelate ligase
MRLDQLLAGVDVVEVRGEPTAVDISAVTHDSRSVRPATLFCCVTGTHVDGHQFAAEAVSAGAAALLVTHLVDVDTCQVVVPDVRRAMALAAANLQGRPADHLDVVGVTGTNGKTTTTWLLRSILLAAGEQAEVIGNLTAEPGGPPNTPDAPALQERLKRALAENHGWVAMEVSSHALAQQRVDGIRFRASVFTNLTQDHLDYHGTLEDYFKAKARLFEPERTELGVINADDEHGRRLLADDALVARRVTYSLDDVSDLSVTAGGSTFTWRGRRLRIHLAGMFNVSNALAAATTAAELGFGDDAIAAGLDALASIPGRMEVVDAGQPFLVVVDYAHTPDGLTQLLGAARALAGDGQLIAVFGAGGDRDPTKRPAMGAAVAELADRAVVTSDNPRSEDPAAIIDAVVGGMRGPATTSTEPDREAAIALAFSMAEPGDVVVLAGKGHETGQEIAGETRPFDDREVARHLLTRRGSLT